MHAAKVLTLKVLGLAIKIMDFVCFTAVVTIFGLPLLERFMPAKPGETYVVPALAQRWLFQPLAPFAALVRARMPHVYHGVDLTPYIVACGLLALSWGLTALLRQIRVDIMAIEEDAALSEAEQAAAKADVANRLAALQAGDETKRERVLELYAQTKKLLDGQRRLLSFLAVDVVNSTGMKQGEDPALAERDFRQYRKLVEAAVAGHEALRASWTPDGVMVCFASLDDAVLAAQDLIRGLAHFNRSVKSIKADFKVRCGVNSGSVMFDESMAMEQMSDGSIDLAGHMQKYAEPDTIYAAKSVVDGRGAELGFSPAGKQVDGCDVMVWRA